ncbi:MAG: MlaE family ABC transporter permease [Alphaproteobacteria bacterium]
MRFISPIHFLSAIGATAIALLSSVGRLGLFALKSVFFSLCPPYRPALLGKQLLQIGFYSLPVVGLTALFTGMVLALQSHTGFSRFQAESAVATVVVLSITRELGPVLGGLMVAGRVGAAIAAEIGTMRVTEQIDALEVMGCQPFRYLVAPRLLAGVLCLPFLAFIADIIGVLGGYIIGVNLLGFQSTSYINSTIQYLQTEDVVSGLIKASVFGFILVLMGCYHGFQAERGAQGVGLAATRAVVGGSILILLFNYALTQLFFSK